MINKESEEPGPLKRALIDASAGAIAGAVSRTVTSPLDVIKIRFQVYPNMRSAFVDLLKTRGVKGLYAGLSPTLIEIIPYAGLQFGTYDTFKRWMMAFNRYRYSSSTSANTDHSLSSFQLIFCGLGAGTTAKLVCHPLDVVKKRFQVEGLQRHPRYGERVEQHKYKNMFDALYKILRSEGWHGLYKGIIPSTIKAAPAAAVTFLAYEFTSHWLESILS